MNKICGYTCEHNKGGICQLTMCDKKIVMTTTTNEPFEKRFDVKYDEQGVEKFARWLDPTIEEYKQETERLNKLLEEKEKEIETLLGIVKELEEDNKKLLNHLKVGVDKE